MASISIVYDNAVDLAGAVITHSTEAGSDFVAENVRIWDPAEAFGTTVLTPGFIQVDFGIQRTIDVVAPLEMNITRQRNLLRDGEDPSSGNWTRAGISSIDIASIAPPVPGINAYAVVEDSSTGNHRINQPGATRGSIAGTPASAYNYIASAYIQRSGGTRNARLDLLVGGASVAHVTVDPDDGSIQASSGTASVVAVGAWFRISVYAQQTRIENQFGARLGLTSGTTQSYAGDGTSDMFVAGLQVEQGTAPTAFGSAGAKYGPMMRCELDKVGVWTTADTFDTAWRHAPVGSVDLNGDTRVHGAEYTPNLTTDAPGLFNLAVGTAVGQFLKVSISDPDNGDGAIRIGRLIAGAVYQPGRYNMDALGTEGLARHESIRRASGSDYVVAQKDPAFGWRGVSIPAVSESERHTEWRRMFRSTHGFTKPVLVFEDPAERIFTQQRMIYGWLRNVRVVREYGNSAGESFFRISFDVEEFR